MDMSNPAFAATMRRYIAASDSLSSVRPSFSADEPPVPTSVLSETSTAAPFTVSAKARTSLFFGVVPRFHVASPWPIISFGAAPAAISFWWSTFCTLVPLTALTVPLTTPRNWMGPVFSS